MNNQLLKRVAMRFVRAFLAGAFASMVGVMAISGADWGEFVNWMGTLMIAGVIGGVSGVLQAGDFYFRNKSSQK